MKKILKTIITISTAGVLFGCAHKVDKYEDYNRTDAQWLEIISQRLQKDELDKADAAYVSLYSEHITSPLLRPAALMLSKAHSDAQEYKLANYYIDEFNKLFGNAHNQDWCEFIKVRNDYYALALPQRNQSLLFQTLANTQKFLQNYPSSEYAPLVASIKSRLELSRYLMDLDIKKLYERMGHKISAEKIQERINANDLAGVQYIKPDLVWYRQILE